MWISFTRILTCDDYIAVSMNCQTEKTTILLFREFLMILATMTINIMQFTFSNIIDEMQFYNPTVSRPFIKGPQVHLHIQYIHWSYASDPHLYSKKPLTYWLIQKLALFILFIRLKHRQLSSIGRVILIKTNRIATKMSAFE